MKQVFPVAADKLRQDEERMNLLFFCILATWEYLFVISQQTYRRKEDFPGTFPFGFKQTYEDLIVPLKCKDATSM